MKKSQLPPVCRLLQDSAENGVHPASPGATVAAGGDGAAAVDLRQEGTNMQRLVLAQQEAQPPLANSSRQARLVLGQF
ncbi:hypothetical protein KOM00_15530 [Geomonas sp. Red69]|uniref:hypothetical protein n=1 Tax=Geomonas diazotrophica TaxID=2843197 RepID=UPI001C0FED15|nr:MULTISPECIES: hypothetical protein [Geomonas]MBU5638141.1 hypothetical protein [Geomonas diazotrophica]QXE84949.1 hypothetical protein KP003_11090 [Geomonas nitrogeniifigens]